MSRPPFPTAARFALLAPFILLGLAACGEGRSADPKSEAKALPRAVLAEPVTFATHATMRNFVGTVRPRIESNLGFRVAGKIAERKIALGERVKVGDVLATLDPVDLHLQREQAEAELTAATVSLDQNERQRQRNIELKRNGWVTDATLQAQQSATAEAKSRLDRARRSLELAANQLSYARLIADNDGVVTAVLAEPGQVVAAGTPVLRVAQNHELEIAVDIPESLTARVREGTASVTLWSNPGRSYDARLREFAAAADASSRTFAARFTILDADPAMNFGMTATLSVREGAAAPVARLPIAAMLDEGKGPTVFVIEPATSKLTSRAIEIAGYDGADMLVSKGLAAGDIVVTHGVHKLLAGEIVRVVADRG
ncbi:efflux RND transporter periplasmic adaptor subunit [Candidatus Raskinella chloraquaticus]